MDDDQPCTSQQERPNDNNIQRRHQQHNNSTTFDENSISASGSGGISNERERRKTAFDFQAKIREEQHKAEQGIFSEQKIDEFFRNLHVSEELNEVESVRTLKAESEALDQLIQLSATQLDSLRNETAKSLDPDLMLARIKNLVRREQLDREGNVFSNLGKYYTALYRSIPDFYFLRPCIELKNCPQLRERHHGEHRTIKRKLGDVQEIRAKTLRQLKEETADDASVSKELDNVKKHLRQFYKEEQSNEVDYYKFVINPYSFGETIENMFYISFLVKDGTQRLRIDPQSGYPKIVRISRQERDDHLLQRSELETKQVIGRLDYSVWQRLVHVLEIKEPYIKRRA